MKKGERIQKMNDGGEKKVNSKARTRNKKKKKKKKKINKRRELLRRYTICIYLIPRISRVFVED